MNEFTITNGSVHITDDEFQVNRSPFVGLKRFYQWRRRIAQVFIVLYIIILVFLFTTDIFGTILEFTYIAIFLLLPASIIGTKVLEFFGREQSTTIPKEAIIRAEYDGVTRFKLSRIKLFYIDDGDEKDMNIWIRFLGSINGGEIESAVTTLESEGIETQRGKYTSELQEG